MRPFKGTSVSAAGAILRGSLAQNRTRVALAVLAIALGVAMGYAVQLINAAAVNELAQGVHTLSGDADLEVRGPRNGFDETLYPTVARMPEVAVASPVVEVDAKVIGSDAVLKIVGIDVFRAGFIQPALIAPSADRLDTLRPDALFPSPAAARSLSVQAGDVVHVQVGLNDVPLRVVGVLAGGGNQRFAIMDIAGAQSVFARLGKISRIDLRLKPGVDVIAFAALLALARKLVVEQAHGAGDGGQAAAFADHVLLVRSDDTARIQEMHLLLLHLLSAMVDRWAEATEPRPSP